MVSQAQRGIAIALALAGGVLAAVQVGKVPAALPALQAQLELSLVQGGWIAGSIAAVSALLGLVSGLVSARLGTRTALVIGLLLLALGSFIGAISPSGAFLLGSRLIEGAGFVLVVVSTPSIVAAAADPARRQLWLSVWGCYMPTGISAMILLTPLLIAWSGWRAVWWFSTLLVMGACILA